MDSRREIDLSLKAHLLPVSLDLRHRLLRALEEFLHLFHIHLRCRIMLVPHHLLDPRRIGISEQGKGSPSVMIR